jgi:hypothetical protein
MAREVTIALHVSLGMGHQLGIGSDCIWKPIASTMAKGASITFLRDSTTYGAPRDQIETP